MYYFYFWPCLWGAKISGDRDPTRTTAVTTPAPQPTEPPGHSRCVHIWTKAWRRGRGREGLQTELLVCFDVWDLPRSACLLPAPPPTPAPRSLRSVWPDWFWNPCLPQAFLIGFPLLPNKLAQAEQLKLTCIYYRRVSVGAESGDGLVGGCSWVSTRLSWRSWPGLRFLLVAWLGKNLLPSSRILAEFISLRLCGWGPGLFAGAGQTPPETPCHIDFWNMTDASIKGTAPFRLVRGSLP